MKEKTNFKFNRAIAPFIKDGKEFELSLPPFKKATLSNGTEVYLIDMGDDATTMISWIFDASMLWEEKNVVSVATNALLKSGTRTRSALGINECFNYYGSYTSGMVQYETAEFTIRCLNKHIKDILPLVVDILSESTFPREELENFKRNSQQQLRVFLKRSDVIASRLVNTYLYGARHPYGKLCVAEDYQALSRDDLTSYFDRFYRHGACRIVVVGQLQADLLARLESGFGSLPMHAAAREAAARHFFPILPATCKKYNITNDLNGVQGSIRIARSLPNQHHPDFHKMPMLNIIFGGYSGSRLAVNIRDGKGYAYEINSYLINNGQAGTLLIATEANKDDCASIIQEIYQEMNHLCKEPISETELQSARNFVMGSILGDLDSPAYVATYWKNILLNGQADNYFKEKVRAIKTITSEELNELAIKYLDPTAFFELTVV